jgi:hypothetical protein
MSERKWTPGPWFQSCESIDPDWHIVTTKGGGVIANVFAPQNANANLIAAAPDMLEALRALMDLNDNGGPFGGEIYQDRLDRAWRRARAAIAKAEGRT